MAESGYRKLCSVFEYDQIQFNYNMFIKNTFEYNTILFFLNEKSMVQILEQEWKPIELFWHLSHLGS
jgi:hypothetical protein